MVIFDLSGHVVNPEPGSTEIHDPEQLPGAEAGAMQLDDKYKLQLDPDKITPDLEEETETENAGPGTEAEADTWNPAEIADLLVDTIDFLQEKTGEHFHLKSILTADQREDLRGMLVEYNIKKINSIPAGKLSFYQKSILERQATHEEYVKILPFTPDEKRSLKSAWRRYLKNKNAKISDGAALMVTTATIFAPRILPIIVNMFDKDKKNLFPDTTAQQAAETRALNEMVKVMDSLNINEMEPAQFKQVMETLRKKAAEAKG